jgi:undecaprenyl-diphosphatase
MTFSLTDLVRGLRDFRPATVPVAMLAIAGLGIWGFLAIADEMAEGEIDAFDTRLLLYLRNPADPSDPIGPPWLEETAIEITALGGYPLIVLTLAAVIGFLLVTRRPGPALYALLSVAGGTVVSQLLKSFYDRPRPDLVAHLDTIHTASFPSGHAMMSTVAYLTLAALIVRIVESRAARAYVLTVAVLVSAAVGASRVYLGVHWPSDVAAGWAMGIAWASLSWLAVSALRRWAGRGSRGEAGAKRLADG